MTVTGPLLRFAVCPIQARQVELTGLAVLSDTALSHEVILAFCKAVVSNEI